MKSSGITLIELLIVIALIIILAVVAYSEITVFETGQMAVAVESETSHNKREISIRTIGSNAICVNGVVYLNTVNGIAPLLNRYTDVETCDMSTPDDTKLLPL